MWSAPDHRSGGTSRLLAGGAVSAASAPPKGGTLNSQFPSGVALPPWPSIPATKNNIPAPRFHAPARREDSWI